jgi:hypothetical protein
MVGMTLTKWITFKETISHILTTFANYGKNHGFRLWHQTHRYCSY